MPVTMQAQYFGASATEPAGANAETGIKFNREDTQSGTTPIPIPTTASGTNYSWRKNLALSVTATAATTISNRRLYLASAPATGLELFFKAASTYTQASSGDKPADDATTNGVDPAGYTAITATTLAGAHVWHATGVSGGSSGRNGDFLVALLGVSANFAGGAGSATSLPSISAAYDES